MKQVAILSGIAPSEVMYCWKLMKDAIYVTKSIKPDPEEFSGYMARIIEDRVFTNNGPKCGLLEEKLGGLVQSPFIALCANGTLGLEIALHAAGLAGKKIITTPFSYVATVSAPLWVGCDVVFADIDEENLSIDPARIADLLDDDVAGVLAVNVYGHPCDYEAIRQVLPTGKPVIYDAAQAFGASLHGKSLLSFGDMAVCSFHATKPFHTFEGGCVVCHDAETLEKLRLLRAFGHAGDEHVCLGINAKLSEAHAAMGLAILPVFEKERAKREKISKMYDVLLRGANIRIPVVPAGFYSNYTYYPVIFDSESALLGAMKHLAGLNIHPRRYFYPSLNTLPYVHGNHCPISESVSRRVLCLPLYGDLPEGDVEKVAEVVDEISKIYR